MINFYSNYYEKDIELIEREQEILFKLYKEIAENQGFEMEVTEPEEICDSSSFDHVGYHIENFADPVEYPDYNKIKHLFE